MDFLRRVIAKSHFYCFHLEKDITEKNLSSMTCRPLQLGFSKNSFPNSFPGPLIGWKIKGWQSKFRDYFSRHLEYSPDLIWCSKFYSYYRDRSCENVPIISLYKLFQVWRTSNNNTTLPSASHHHHPACKSSFSFFFFQSLKIKAHKDFYTTPPEALFSVLYLRSNIVALSLALALPSSSSQPTLDRKKLAKF